MKLRIARKIMKAVGTPDEARYSRHQIGRAFTRTEQMKSARQSYRYFCALMDHLGVDGRAELLSRSGAPGMAFGLLMREGNQAAGSRDARNGPRMPQDELATSADRSDVGDRPGLTGEPGGRSLGVEVVAGLVKVNDALEAGVPLGECALVRIAKSGDKDADSGEKERPR